MYVLKYFIYFYLIINHRNDKLSMSMQVIEYIQFLQDKVQKYEGPYPGWNQELSKPMPSVKLQSFICFCMHHCSIHMTF